jgi:hypothetical protein
MLAVAPARIYISCSYDWRMGWSLKTTCSADEHHDPLVEVYGPLSSRELVDIVGSIMAALVATRLEST